MTGSEEIAVVIGINKCNEAGVCASPDESMGTVLYNGPFNPEFHEYNMPPYQNFSLLVPASAAAQQGIVTVAHFSLVGVSDSSHLTLMLTLKEFHEVCKLTGSLLYRQAPGPWSNTSIRPFPSFEIASKIILFI